MWLNCARSRRIKIPLVFFINMHGGHGGSTGRYDRIKEQDRRHAFMLTQLGITQ
jgi:oligopeptidase B